MAPVVRVLLSIMVALFSFTQCGGCPGKNKDGEKGKKGNKDDKDDKDATSTTSKKNKKALVVIDVQASFMQLTGRSKLRGNLGVSNSELLPEKISKLIEWNDVAKFFDVIIFSQDFHNQGHISFGSAHTPNPGYTVAVHCRFNTSLNEGTSTEDVEDCCAPTWNGGKRLNGKKCTKCLDTENCKTIKQNLWPDHCINDITSLEVVTGDLLQDRSPDLEPNLRVKTVNGIEVIVVRKGTYIDRDAYSIFADWGIDTLIGTHKILKDKKITELYMTGLATDYCVGNSAWHALRMSKDQLRTEPEAQKSPEDSDYKVVMIEDLMHGVNFNHPRESEEMLTKIQKVGGQFTTSSELLLGVLPRHQQGEADWGNSQLQDLHNDKRAKTFVDAVSKQMTSGEKYKDKEKGKVENWVKTAIISILVELDTTLKADTFSQEKVELLWDKLNHPEVDRVLRKAGLKTDEPGSRDRAKKALEDFKAKKNKVERAAYKLKIKETRTMLNELGKTFDEETLPVDETEDPDDYSFESYNSMAATLVNLFPKKGTSPWKAKKPSEKTHFREEEPYYSPRPQHLVLHDTE